MPSRNVSKHVWNSVCIMSFPIKKHQGLANVNGTTDDTITSPKLWHRHDHSRSLVRVVSQQSLGRVVLEHCGRWKHLSRKVLSPYFLSPCRKWHKKGSSPTNHSNAEVLRPSVYSNVVGFHGRGFIAMSWVLRPRVYSNVHALLSRYVYLLGSCSRVLTITND